MPQQRLHQDHATRQAAYRKRMADARQKEQQDRGLPALPAAPTMPGTARWSRAISAGLQMFTTVRDEMQNYYDERSEAWQQSERAEEFQERIDAIEEIIGLMEGLA